MSFTAGGKITDYAAVVATIDPDAYTAAAYVSDGIDMSLWQEVMFIVEVGTLGSSATVDFFVDGGTDNSTFATPITGKAITQLTDAGTDSDKQAIVLVTEAECTAQGVRYIRGELTVATATSDCGMIAIAFGPNYGPASANDLASVDEIVA